MSSRCLLQGDMHLDGFFLIEILHMVYFWNHLGARDVNYNPLKVSDSYLDDQGGQECIPFVFCKDTGILMKFSHLKPYICYIFLIFVGKRKSTITN